MENRSIWKMDLIKRTNFRSLRFAPYFSKTLVWQSIFIIFSVWVIDHYSTCLDRFCWVPHPYSTNEWPAKNLNRTPWSMLCRGCSQRASSHWKPHYGGNIFRFLKQSITEIHDIVLPQNPFASVIKHYFICLMESVQTQESRPKVETIRDPSHRSDK